MITLIYFFLQREWKTIIQWKTIRMKNNNSDLVLKLPTFCICCKTDLSYNVVLQQVLSFEFSMHAIL